MSALNEADLDHPEPLSVPFLLERQVLDDRPDDEDEYVPADDDLQSISSLETGAQQADKTLQPVSPNVTSDRTVPVLRNNAFAQEPTYFTRTNRWFGPDSTWLSWTEDERVTVQALDRARSQNLSLHLYNAHALEASAKQFTEMRRKLRKGKAPDRPGNDTEPAQLQPLVPPRGWTDWPLPPHQVPRETLIPQTGRDIVYRKQQDHRPSANLEECLVATTTRLARERWKERSWQSEFPKRQWGIKIEEGEEDAEMEESPELSTEESDAADTYNSESNSASDNAGDQLYTSQAYDIEFDEEEVKETKPIEKLDEFLHDQRPVPIADDDKARDLLLPGARQILGNVDGLLMGLHKARQAYASTSRKKRGHSPARGRSVTSDTDVESVPTKLPGQNRKRKRHTSAVSAASTASGSTASGDLEEGDRRQRKSGPRNWSDVIGMAALTGWDPSVVERASQRCANLFGENMLFRTFHEGDRSRKQAAYFTELEAIDNEDASEAETHIEGSMAMVRTSQACEMCRTSREACEVEDETEGRATCKRCTKRRLVCSGIEVKVYNATGRCCPYVDCERHNIPFRKAYRLQRHLDTIHQHQAPPSEASNVPPPLPTEELVSSVEIICPVTTCPRHRQPFSRGTKLYEHIRNMHPEIDINEIKKLESTRRGERRGKYRDESRRSGIGRSNRSRSKGVIPYGDSDVASDPPFMSDVS